MSTGARFRHSEKKLLMISPMKRMIAKLTLPDSTAVHRDLKI